MNLFGIDFTPFFQPLLALCGALALVLNARNQDLSRLIRSGTEQVTRRENGRETIDPTRKEDLRRQAVVFRERILIVQQGLLLTYTAGISLTLMAGFSRVPFPFHNVAAEVFGAFGILAVVIACASAVRDIVKSIDTTEMELISAYGPEILPPHATVFRRRPGGGRRSFRVRLADGLRAFGKAFARD
ncbi:MAG: DUF2721 domain-containing protein [Capsulimonadales bacterium]|nr:DUF2721 domain-containing protein [Capsulimonadales bacterium]